MTDFQVKGHWYRSRPMAAMTQLHVSRKIAPMVVSMFRNFQEMSTAAALATQAQAQGESVNGTGIAPEPARPDKFVALFQPMSDALANMDKKDFDFVIESCLSTVTRCDGDPNEGKPWAQVWNSAAGMPQFPDIRGPTILTIAVNVIQDELADFFSELPFASGGGGLASTLNRL